jgi:hypothetical protein
MNSSYYPWFGGVAILLLVLILLAVTGHLHF